MSIKNYHHKTIIKFFVLQVGERLVEYGQMQVVTAPAENLNLVFQTGQTPIFTHW